MKTRNQPRKLPNASSRYGASMGRSNYIPLDNASVKKLHLIKLQWIDGDYDNGGAYWGNSGGTNIYWAYENSKESDNDSIAEIFIRAKSRKDAREQVIATFPNAKFYN